MAHDDPPGQRLRAGPAAGRQCQHDGRCRTSSDPRFSASPSPGRSAGGAASPVPGRAVPAGSRTLAVAAQRLCLAGHSGHAGGRSRRRRSMPGASDLSFVISADYARSTGGWIYDQRSLQGLAQHGWQIRRTTLPAGFPQPSPQARKRSAAAFKAFADGTWCWSISFASGCCPRFSGRGPPVAPRHDRCTTHWTLRAIAPPATVAALRHWKGRPCSMSRA